MVAPAGLLLVLSHEPIGLIIFLIVLVALISYSCLTTYLILDWENVFVKDTSDKRLLFKLYKELLELSNKKTNSQPGGRGSVVEH